MGRLIERFQRWVAQGGPIALVTGERGLDIVTNPSEPPADDQGRHDRAAGTSPSQVGLGATGAGDAAGPDDAAPPVEGDLP